ncbi:MAG: hypothetical protein AB7N53_19590 [Candidatus Binatia bacterium]
MGKRIVSNFSRAGFPSTEAIDEDGQAKPAVYGVRWVNPDTLATLPKHGGKRTGPKGEPLDGLLVERPIRR